MAMSFRLAVGRRCFDRIQGSSWIPLTYCTHACLNISLMLVKRHWDEEMSVFKAQVQSQSPLPLDVKFNIKCFKEDDRTFHARAIACPKGYSNDGVNHTCWYCFSGGSSVEVSSAHLRISGMTFRDLYARM